MKVISVQTVRFAKLVESYGKPFSKTLWTDPEADAELKKAVKQNRVLTVAQANVGTKKDIGIIGFHPKKRGAILLFPKPLGYSAGTKVIGIKWDMIAEAPARNPINWKALPKAKAKTTHGSVIPFPHSDSLEETPEQAPPVVKPPKRFEVVLEFRGKVQITRTVEATSRRAAREIAVSEKGAIDWSQASITSAIKRIKEI